MDPGTIIYIKSAKANIIPKPKKAYLHHALELFRCRTRDIRHTQIPHVLLNDKIAYQTARG